MQPSSGSSRVRLNRDAFRLEQGQVTKRRRLRGSECTDPVSDAHAARSEGSAARAGPAPRREPARAARDARRQRPSRITGCDVRIPVQSNQATHESCRGPCTLNDCRNNTNNISNINNCSNNNNNASRRKQIRCHLHLALRFCGSDKSARRHGEGEQSVSCTVSRYVNGDVRVQTSSSSGDAIGPRAGSAGQSVANQGVSKSGVKPEKVRLGPPEKKDGRAAELRPSKNRFNTKFMVFVPSWGHDLYLLPGRGSCDVISFRSKAISALCLNFHVK